MLRLGLVAGRRQALGVRSTFERHLYLPAAPPPNTWLLVARLEHLFLSALPLGGSIRFVAHDERGHYETRTLAALRRAVLKRDRSPTTIEIVIFSRRRHTLRGRVTVNQCAASEASLEDVVEIRLLGLVERIRTLFSEASSREAGEFWLAAAAVSSDESLGAWFVRFIRTLWNGSYPWLVAIGGGVIAILVVSLWLGLQ